MYTGSKASNCVIPKTAFKILCDVAPEAIEKFIATRNALYPRGPPAGPKKTFQQDWKTGNTQESKGNDATTIPKQYDKDDRNTLTTHQSEPKETNDEQDSNATYGNGKESEDDNKKNFTDFMRIIGMAKQYGWEEQNIMNMITMSMKIVS